jgi:3-oxoacyl-[acyl-carrier-protein] synthase II
MKQAVITGIGVVSPLGVGWDAWGAGLRAGVSGTREITLFNAHCPVPAAPGRAALPLACRVAAEATGFQPGDVMDKRDLERVPRTVPMTLAATAEALRAARLIDAGGAEREGIDVVIGSGGGGFSFAEEQFTHWCLGEDHRLSPYAVSSSIPGMLSSEISLAFGLRGRSHTFSDGCTSSTDALGNALDLIRSGRSRCVVTGGADAPITPGTIAAFCLMRAVPTRYNESPQQASRPCDRDRDGFVLGEGAWIFVVEEREHALQRGVPVLAEIAGYGATCEAYHRVAIGAPHEAARAMALALRDAAVAPAAIDYVNLHGTGTELNDPLETAAVKLALGDRAYEIPLSATKSQIGHPQGASGAAGIAATIAAMQGGFVPPTINLDHPDPRCDLDYVPRHARPAQIRTALCNCLGFGSKNAALVLRKG